MGRRCGPRPGSSSLKWGPGGAPQTSIQPANEGLVTSFSPYSSTPAPCVQTPHLLATKYRLRRPACPRPLAGSGCHLISHLPLQRECMGLRCSLPGLAGGFGLDRVQPELRTGPPAQTLHSRGEAPIGPVMTLEVRPLQASRVVPVAWRQHREALFDLNPSSCWVA